MSGTTAAPTTQHRLRDEILPPLIILTVALGFWELSVRVLDIPPWLLPAPSDVVDRYRLCAGAAGQA